MSESATVTPTAWVYNGDEWRPLLFILMIAGVIAFIICLISICAQCCVCSGSPHHHSDESSEQPDNSPQTIENNSDSTSYSYDYSY